MSRNHHFDSKHLTLWLPAAALLLAAGTAQAQHHHAVRAHHTAVQAHHSLRSFSSAAAQSDGITLTRKSASTTGRNSNAWTLSGSEGPKVACTGGSCTWSPSSTGGSSFWSRWRQGWHSHALGAGGLGVSSTALKRRSITRHSPARVAFEPALES